MASVKVLVGTKKAGLRLHLGREAAEVGGLGADPAGVVVLPHVGGHARLEAADVRGGEPLGVGAVGREERGRREDVGLQQQGPRVPAGHEGVQGEVGRPSGCARAIGTTRRQASSATSGTSRPGTRASRASCMPGTQPAGLFRSEDWGQSWQPVESINRHENRKFWNGTGGGDSCIHSIHVHPDDAKRIFLCVGAGGSYKSKDGGETWELFSQNAIVTNSMGKKLLAELVQEMPEAAAAGEGPGGYRRAAQDAAGPEEPGPHLGTSALRRVPLGRRRRDVDGRDGGAAFVPRLPDRRHAPRSGRRFRRAAGLRAGQLPRGARASSASTAPRTPGKSWQPLTKGLPGPNDYQSVYREGLDTDGLDSEGVYVGTSNGEVYASADGGESWMRLPGTLPPVLSVTAAVFVG